MINNNILMVNIKYIDSQALICNLKSCKKCGRSIMTMVKADAYGHGMDSVVNILKNKVEFWGVANSDEAVKLQRLLDRSNTILVVGKSFKFKELVKNNIDITIDSLDDLIYIKKVCGNIYKANIHIAVNTGMNRIGIKTLTEFKQILKFIKSNKCLVLKGIFTHCFDEDLPDNHFDLQMTKFKKFVDCVKDKNVLVHIGGSFCLNNKIPDFINMVRVGYFLYGYGNPQLKPVMSIESRVVKITHCGEGEFVGYGKTQLVNDKTIALVPIGYADGIPFNFAGGGKVYIKNKPCPVLGRICMDMMMVDVSDIEVSMGDRVAVFNNADHYAEITKTSTYEILSNLCKARAKVVVR